jgi:Fe-S-cluster containining protein
VHESRPNVCRDFPFFRTCGAGFAQRASFCPALEALENEGGG